MKRLLIIALLMTGPCGMLNAQACKVSDDRPDSSCTPGDVRTETTMKDVCTPNFTKTVRNVPESLKNTVYSDYNMKPKQSPCPCEIDHFVSLVLGGSNDQKNLWPQSYQGKFNAREKDKLENFVHREVCKGKIPLDEAQREIRDNWKTYYLKYGLDKKGNGGSLERNEE